MELATFVNSSARTTTSEKILWREKVPDEESEEFPLPLTEDKTLDTDVARENWEEMTLVAVLEENFSPASKLEGGWGESNLEKIRPANTMNGWDEIAAEQARLGLADAWLKGTRFERPRPVRKHQRNRASPYARSSTRSKTKMITGTTHTVKN